jgi:hypothetical protein
VVATSSSLSAANGAVAELSGGGFVTNSVDPPPGVFVGRGVDVDVAYLARINVGVSVGRTPILNKSPELQAIRMIADQIV